MTGRAGQALLALLGPSLWCLGKKERARGSSESVPGTVGTDYETGILLQVRQHKSAWPRTQRQAQACLTPQAGLSPSCFDCLPQNGGEKDFWQERVGQHCVVQGLAPGFSWWLAVLDARPVQMPSWLSNPIQISQAQAEWCRVPEAQEVA